MQILLRDFKKKNIQIEQFVFALIKHKMHQQAQIIPAAVAKWKEKDKKYKYKSRPRLFSIFPSSKHNCCL